MIWGVNRVHRHVGGVDGDWLEKWGEDEGDEEPVRYSEGSSEEREQLVRAEEIKNELKRLSRLAASVEPGLANRLEEMSRWVKDKKPGLLVRKKTVLLFLLELIEDARFWLDIKALTPETRQAVFDRMTPSQRYWHGYLFPKWFNEPDPKLSIWKQKMMAGDFREEDYPLIKLLLYHAQKSGGSAVRRYIIDLSMATDLVVSGHLGVPLCVQLTTIASDLAIDKKQAWEVTLRYWGIERGLFVSFNPGNQPDIVGFLADEILRQSDELPSVCYNEWSVGQ